MPKQRYKHLSPTALLLLSTIFAAFFLRHVSADDGQAMAMLAKSIIPTPSGWTGSDFCDWQGVSCDSSGQVTSINLSSKSLSGTIAAEINHLASLKSLSLQRNHFSGPVPALSNLGSLEQVNLDDNSFDSLPKDFLSGLTSLQFFTMNNNTNLPPWRIPDSLSDSTSLTSFSASSSNIMGEIPDVFGSLPNFLSLRLSYNNLTGSLPGSFANSGIQNLTLNNQGSGLSGMIDVLASMTQLRVVWLHSNSFTGQIPDLSACKELSDLLLRDNSLTGVIPDSLTKLPNLKNVALQHNKFQGPMPSFPPGIQVNLGTTNNFCLPSPGPCSPEVNALLEAAREMKYPMTLAEDWVGNNPCQQWQFITCEDGRVTIINFARQNWTGTISPAYANLTELKSLLLNDNKLEGTIPQSLTTLKYLRILDVSNNNISGKVPAFASSVTVRVSGNANIGKDIPLSGSGRGPSSAENGASGKDGQGKTSFPAAAIIALVVVFFIAGAVSGFFIYIRHKNKKNKMYKWVSKGKEEGNGENQLIVNVDMPKDNAKSSSASSNSAQKSDYHIHDGGNVIIPVEVLREATNNFSENNILGRGGFGIVYKGQLQDGTKIAVKRMESCMISDKGLHEFKAEIEVLKKVRHRNLVTLHGFCENGSERLLVYEHMPRGSLGDHLFHWKETGIPPLNWNQRLMISLDIARGVEYLHSLAQQSFIHRDLKPSNILLGEDMRAKVSDFGLVRSAPDGNYSVETRLAGTFGYLAPEYASTGRVTTKVDVYAFGVILMELITGRKALDDSLPDERSHLVAWFRRFIMDKAKVKEALDHVLLSMMDEESFQCMWKVVELAGYCTAREPHQRPDMFHAVNVLSPLVEQWKPTLDNGDSFKMDMSMSMSMSMSLPQVLQNWKANEGASTFSSSFFNGETKDYGTSTASTVTMEKRL